MEAERYYQILEIQPGASAEEIKQAYRDLAKVWHPDRFLDDPRLHQKAQEKLKQINAAYGFLMADPLQVKNVAEEPKRQGGAIALYPDRLEKLLELKDFKNADYETKRLLLELTGRSKEGWLLPENVKGLPMEVLLAIDQLWVQSSNGRFGWSVQSQTWRSLGCDASADIYTQTLSENTFGKAVRWYSGSTWLSPWDSFDYSLRSPRASLPREYIFALSGWHSHIKGWSGYLLWRFDEIFLRLL